MATRVHLPRGPAAAKVPRMPWWIWAQAAVDLVFLAYVVALSFGSHDERDRTRALAAEIEDLKRKL